MKTAPLRMDGGGFALGDMMRPNASVGLGGGWDAMIHSCLGGGECALTGFKIGGGRSDEGEASIGREGA